MIRSLSNTFDKSLNVTTGKDIVSTTGDVVKAKESLSRIEKNLFYRLGMYLRSKLGTQLVNCSHISPIQRSTFSLTYYLQHPPNRLCEPSGKPLDSYWNYSASGGLQTGIHDKDYFVARFNAPLPLNYLWYDL